MEFVLFILFSVIIFLLSLVSYEKFRSTTLYALAIGGVVNANFFYAGNYPIECFGIPFGIDSIIYTLFLFCVVLMFLKENKREAYILSISSIIAIVFSASMQLFASLFYTGSSVEVWKLFSTFMVSAGASFVSIWIMLELLAKLKNKGLNQYLLLIIGLLLANKVNSAIYYTAATLINGTPSNIWLLMVGSVIGKLIALGCAVLVLFLSNKIDKFILNYKKKNM
jgi:hypothetical protein